MKIALPKNIQAPTVALGGDLKCRPVWAENGTAEVLDEIGDLAAPEAQDKLEALLERLSPEIIACDRHPGYYSTQLGERIAAERGCRLQYVQHHRAHVAAVCLERDLFDEPVIGLAFDGTGYGDDGVAWGGEIFSGSLNRGFTRVAHFAPLPLPGGDAAVRGPWRIALALLAERGVTDAQLEKWIALRQAPIHNLTLFQAGLKAKLALGRSTALGRWFDVVSALLGVRVTAAFEAEPAIELQKLAETVVSPSPAVVWPYAIGGEAPAMIDFPTIPELAFTERADAAALAYAFHVSVARAVAEVAAREAREQGAKTVIASGGVFLNRLLDRLLQTELTAYGLPCVKSQQLPPGDQAIALGQIGLALTGLDQ